MNQNLEPAKPSVAWKATPVFPRQDPEFTLVVEDITSYCLVQYVTQGLPLAGTMTKFGDLIASITLGAVLVPQGVAYAQVADLLNLVFTQGPILLCICHL